MQIELGDESVVKEQYGAYSYLKQEEGEEEEGDGKEE